MMIRQKTAFAAVLVCTLLLQSCGSKNEPEEVVSSGARSAILSMHTIAKRSLSGNRPSPLLGMFTSLYISQGIFLPVEGAMTGFESIGSIYKGQTTSTTNENFALLREIGDILQVNIEDLLNRSEDRAKALNGYISSLNTAGILAERKMEQLEAIHDNQKVDLREKRDRVRDIERNIRDALNIPDYAKASEFEEQLAGATAIHAEAEVEEEQTGDMINRFETLRDVAAQRYQVLDNNREILIAGLRVVNLPGIADLNILEEGKSWRKRRGVKLFSNPN